MAFRHIDLRAQRFPGLPGLPGLPGYALLDRISERVEAVLPLVEHWPDPRHREMAHFSLGFLADRAVEQNDDQALVSPLDMRRSSPPSRPLQSTYGRFAAADPPDRASRADRSESAVK